MGSEHHTFHVHGHRWKSPFGDRRRHADRRAGGDLPHPLEGGGPRDVAVPLPRRGPHDGRDDRHLPGQAPMRRLALALGATLAALAGPAVSAAQMEHMHGAADDQAAATVGDPVRRLRHAARRRPRRRHRALDEQQHPRPHGHRRRRHMGVGAAARATTCSPTASTRPGVATYYCMLHPFMRGEVDVHNVLLAVPTEPGAPGRSYVLHGRSSAAGGHRRGHRGRHRGGLPAGRPRHRGRRRHVHHRDRAHDDRHLPRGRGRRGQPGRPAARARPQGRGHRGRPGPRRHRQRARRPGLAGGARRPAAAPAPALRLVAGGPRQARPRLGGALLAAPGATATPRASSSPCATAPRRSPSAARCTSGRADRGRTGRMCTFRRLAPWRRHDGP